MPGIRPVRIQIKGLKETTELLEGLNNAPLTDAFSEVLLDAVNLIRSEALSNIYRMTKQKTGNLAKSLISRIGRGNRPSAWVRAGRRLAPHAHLIEYGHRIVTPGGRDTGRRSREIPFWRDAIKSQRTRVRAMVKRAISLLLLDKSFLRRAAVKQRRKRPA